jgi:colicin import membrane protein
MTSQAYYEPHKLSAGVLALAVHGIFFSLLYFGFNWHVKTPESVMVEMWDHLPAPEQVPQPQPEPPPPAPPEQVPPKVETPPPPKVAPPVVVAKPAAQQKADIVLKETKKKKTAKEKEPKPAPKRDDKAKKLELAKQKEQAAQAEQAKLQARAEEMAKERAEDERVSRENERAQELKAKMRAEVDAATRGEVERYTGLIQAKIKRSIVMPPDVADNAVAEFMVTVLPDGSVMQPRLIKSSGNRAYDNAAERAIIRAQPLPLPPEPSLARMFRELHLLVKP